MKINKKIVLILFITLLTIFGVCGKVEASYSASSQTIKSEDNVSIIIKSTEKLESFDIECTDLGGLTYKSCSSSVTGAIVNSAGRKISYALPGGEATTLATYTFKAPTVTEQTKYTVKFVVNDTPVTATITVNAEEKPTEQQKSTNAYLSTLGVKPKEYDFSGFNKKTKTYNVTIPYEVNSLDVLYKTEDSNAKVKVTGNSGFKVGPDNKITIVVTAQDGKTTETYTITVTKLAQKEDTTSETENPTEQPKAKSTNAYLSTLGVTPKEYDFSGFKKTTINYSVTVPYEVDSLKVLYKTEDSNAKVKVTGNSGFEVGSNNKITIKVTAEDEKTTKTYTIKVTKLAEVEEKPGNIIDEEIDELYLTSLSLKGIELSPEFAKDTYAYTATLEKNDVTEVEVNAQANKENASIEISGNTDLVIGENTINIVLKQPDSTLQTVYQITLTKKDVLLTTTIGEDNNFMTNLIDNIKNYVIIAVVVLVLIIAAIVILIILLRKEDEKLNNENTEEEYNVYENDENEFENNKIEEMIEEQKIQEISNETETKNKGRKTIRREKGKHSK